MSVNPDMSASIGVADEYVDLEHQVIRQKIDVQEDQFSLEVLPGNAAAEFDPGERQLDREEIAQLVNYRRFASINFLQNADLDGRTGNDNFAIVDASVGINGDLFRPVTNQEEFTITGGQFFVDSGGEIGLLDNYQLFAQPSSAGQGVGPAGGIAQTADLEVPYYQWPTGGPIVDSFDTITCGFGAGVTTGFNIECQIELRYDFWWDVAEQGRSTNPFGRPSTR
jgi:hypothetical protein